MWWNAEWFAQAMKLFFRTLVTVHVALPLTQPVLVGLFLSGGDHSKLTAHEMVGSSVAATGLFLLVSSVVVWRVAHWPAKVVLWCGVLFVGEAVQLTMGYDRHLGIHVPLGVVLTVAASFLYTWTFRVSQTQTVPA